MVSLTTKYTVPELLEMFGKSKQWLIDESELNPDTIERNLDMSPEGLKTHWTSAQAIAEAFGVDYKTDVRWPRGLTDNGRSAHSGGKIVFEESYTVTRRVVITCGVCEDCRTELPLVGVCGYCFP